MQKGTMVPYRQSSSDADKHHMPNQNSIAPLWGVNPPAAGFDNINELISTGISIALLVGGLIVLVYMFLGGFTYLTAGSDDEKTKKARAIITNAIIGLFLLAAAWAIWQLIISFIPGLSGLLGQ